ncbi:MAG: TIGR04211 family SH3 domain-containing protein [Desulfobacteraceae bacterium]|nr:MAG: TIGR04211 family SH3 domain-containing protein [Desulfobacteraceae bacterium]
MKWRVIIIGLILLASSRGPAYAESVYVSEIIEITLRSGPGIDHKVIAMVKTGQPLQVLEKGDEWTKVRLANEKEGYVLTRFLTDKRPSSMLLEEIDKKYQALEKKAEELREENKRQQAEYQSLQEEFQQKEELLAKLTEAHENLRKDSAEFLSLKTNYKKISTEFNEQTQRTAQLEEAYSKLQKRQIFRWVITGAGILLIGFLIGMSSKRQRRRSTLL